MNASHDEFILSVGQAHELGLAMNRPENGVWTPKLVHDLCQEDTLGRVREVLFGNAEIVDIDFFRETGELSIQIPALPRPSLEELQAKFSWIKEIKCDTSPTEAVTLLLCTVLRHNEECIDGPEYERHLASKPDLCLGYQQANWLFERQDSFPALMAQIGKIYIDFPGIVVGNAGGGRSFPYLGGDGRRWCLHWSWIGGGLGRGGRIASRGK